MKKLILSVTMIATMNSYVFAGGNIENEEILVNDKITIVKNAGFYFGAAYGMSKYTNDYIWNDPANNEYNGKGNDKVEYDSVMLQSGYQFNKYLSIEGRYWKSVGNNNDTWSENWQDRYVNHQYNSGSQNLGDELEAWGIYFKPMYPVTMSFTVYGLLGYGKTTLSDDDENNWFNENNFQWGVGASYEFIDNFSFFVDYLKLHDGTHKIQDTTYIEDDDESVDMVNIGFSYQF